MAIFDNPDWLQGLAPAMTSQDIAEATAAVQPPQLRPKRTIGNVLSDFFSGSRIAQNMRDPGQAAWGDLLGNIARVSRGEDPSFDQMNRAYSLQDYDRQQADLARADEARNAFAQLLIDPSQQNEANLAMLDPETVMGYRDQQAESAAKMAEVNRKSAADQFNFGKPIPLGGNGGYAMLDPDTGEWSVHEGTPPLQWKQTGEGQGGAFDARTGTFKPIGAKKPGANKIVTVQGPNGPEVRMIGPNGETVRNIGAAPPKGAAGKTAAGGNSAAQGVLEQLGDLRSSINELKRLDALVKPGSAPISNFVNRAAASGPGQLIAGAIGTRAQEQRDNVSRIAVSIMQNMKQALGLSARDLDTNQDVQRALSVINNPTTSYENMIRAVDSLQRQFESRLQGGGGSAPSAQPNAAALAEARRRGLVK